MRRRLAFTIVGVVVATLLLAGVGTLALSAVRARTTTIQDVSERANDIAANINELLRSDLPTDPEEAERQLGTRLRILSVFRTTLALNDLVVLVADDRGTLRGEELPAGLTVDDIRVEDLAAGATVSGSRDRVAYAAVGVDGPNGRLWVVVATRSITTGLGAGFVMFLWAAGATILLGFAAAWLLGRRLSKPVRDATAATQLIAAGQLGTRVAIPSAGRHDELSELGHNINAMAESLQRSRVLEQQFLLSVSHDLRTPLTSIRGYAEAIEDGANPARSAAVIKSESRRLERLVADLLDLARLQSRSFRFDTVRLDVAAAARTAAEGAAGSWPEIEFHAVAAAPVMVMADPDRFGQVLANLVENAGKYARSKVLVSARAEDGWAVVTVDDDGRGIAAHDLPHVFERLYVARHAPERTENSSGLGLAIVAELVQAMGGEVSAGAAPSGGARLTVRLPLAP